MASRCDGVVEGSEVAEAWASGGAGAVASVGARSGRIPEEVASEEHSEAVKEEESSLILSTGRTTRSLRSDVRRPGLCGNCVVNLSPALGFDCLKPGY